MYNDVKLTIQFKSLVNVLTAKQQRSLVKEGSEYKDYSESC